MSTRNWLIPCGYYTFAARIWIGTKLRVGTTLLSKPTTSAKVSGKVICGSVGIGLRDAVYHLPLKLSEYFRIEDNGVAHQLDVFYLGVNGVDDESFWFEAEGFESDDV